jgi:hypothetical protein
MMHSEAFLPIKIVKHMFACAALLPRQEHLESLTTRLNMGPSQASPHSQADAPLRGPSPTQRQRQHHHQQSADPLQPVYAPSGEQDTSHGVGTTTGAEEGSGPVQPSMVPALLAGSVMARSLLCWTLAGARCDLITITDFNAPPEVVRQREVVVITARVHPGETCASWIMQVTGVMGPGIKRASCLSNNIK